jgi:hypothetical protein
LLLPHIVKMDSQEEDNGHQPAERRHGAVAPFGAHRAMLRESTLGLTFRQTFPARLA